MQRAFFGADAISPTQAPEAAILGGAQALPREGMGVNAPGKTADITCIIFRNYSQGEYIR